MATDDDIESYLDPVPLNRVVRGGDKLQGVQPELLSHWNNLQGEFTKAGLTPEIKSGFRTAAQQNALFRNPATSARTKGNDGYVNISPHQRGDALDISFPAPQRAKGRQIIASYAQQNSLHVPSDEPWHIAIPRQGKAGIESYLDPQQPTQSTQPAKPASGIENYLDPQEPVIGTGRGAAMARVQGTAYPTRRRAQPQQGWGGSGTIGQGVPNVSVDAMGGSQANGVGGLRQIDDPETSRIIRAQQQVTAEQTPFEKHLALGPGSEESKTLALRRTENEAVLERVAAEKAQEDQSVKQIAWEQENKAEIDRHVADYRKQIRDSGFTKWLTETQAKGASSLMEFGAGGASVVGAQRAANAMRVRAVAAAQAAQEEGQGRTEASKFAQDIIGGFAGSAPELLLMSAGVPPIATFAAGGGLRAKGMGKPVVPAITQGALTGAAFEIPEAGAPGVRRTLTRAGKVGVATAGVDLATGTPVGQALKSGAVNAAMVAGPGIANEPAARAAERTRQIESQTRSGTTVPDIDTQLAAREAAVKPVTDAQGNVLLNADEVAQGGKPRVRLAQGAKNEPATPTDGAGHANRNGQAQPTNAVTEPRPNSANDLGRGLPDSTEDSTNAHTPVRHVDLQPRTPEGQFDEETPAQAEARRQQVTQSVSTLQPDLSTQASPATPDTATKLPEVPPAGVDRSASTPKEPWEMTQEENRSRGVEYQKQFATQQPESWYAAKADANHKMMVERAIGEGKLVPPEVLKDYPDLAKKVGAASEVATMPENAIAKRVKSTEYKPPIEGSPSMTSARKADITADRAEWDLPDLPAPERRGWQQVRQEALADKMDEKANAIADDVLKNPHPLTDKQTAGMVLRLQQIKNEHAAVMNEIGEADPKSDKGSELRARTDMLENEAEKLQRAVTQSGTEKGRALASQKLTINQDMDLVSLIARAKAKGIKITPERRAKYEAIANENADLKAQIAKHESDAKAQSLQAEVNRASRRVKRTQAKQTLDDEAAVIKSNIAAEFARLKSGQARTLSQGGLGALDPDGVITKELAKYLRNRVQSGVNDAAQILDDAYALVKEHVEGITKGDVLDALLAPQRRKQGDLARQMKAVRDELDAMAVTEGRRTKQPQGPKITDAPPVGPTQAYAKTRTAQLLKREAELTRRIREQDYSPSPKRPPIVYNEPLNRLNARVESLRRQYEHDLEANKKVTVPDMLVRWKRFAVLTYPTTFGKLGSAATARMITSPVEELLGSGLGRIPGLKTVFSGPRGKGRLSAETKAVSQLWQSQSFKDMLAHVKGGDDMLSLLYGKHAGDEFYSGSNKGSYVPTTFKDLTDRPGHYHAAMKTIPKRAEFYRSFENRLESARSEGRDVHDPAVQMGLAGEAYVDAQRAILQQPNFLSDAFNRWAGRLEHSQSALGRGLGKAMRFEFPITRVPVNFVGESALHIGGLPAALGETAVRGLSGKFADSKSSSLRSLAERMPDRLDKLEPAQKDRIARAFKKGGVGLGFLAWGMLRPQDFGGYYQPGQRAPDDLKAGQMRFFGVKLPRWMGHIPVLEAAQFGATIRRVYDSMSAKGKSSIEAVKGGAIAATTGIAKEVPMLDPLIEGVRAFKQPIGKTVGEQVKGLEPGLMQWAARTADYGPSGTLPSAVNPFSNQEPVRREQKTGIQTIKEGIPFVRSTLPVSNVFPRASKASDEVQRLGIWLQGAKRSKDETASEFRDRQDTQNTVIRESIETLVSNPDYDKLSNKEKAEQIKAAKDFAVKNAVKPIRNIKDLKPALMQSAPSPSPNLLY